MTDEMLKRLAAELEKADDITVLTHAHPDGDTVGAGFGLVYYLRGMGKRANVKNSEDFPQKFSYLFKDYADMDFEEKCVISADIADVTLLGDGLSDYADRIDICIDHHKSNRMPAKKSFVDGECCAVSLIIYELIRFMGCSITPLIADCLYTGIATDTGCFMFENTSPEAHRAAADLIGFGARAAVINREMFQVKSRGRILAEQEIIGSMRFEFGGQMAIITVTNSQIERFGFERSELDGFAGIPVSVEGVRIGVTLKQQAEDPGIFKASIRTVDTDASAIAARLGGGGHNRAAGCTVAGTAEEAAEKVIEAARASL